MMFSWNPYCNLFINPYGVAVMQTYLTRVYYKLKIKRSPDQGRTHQPRESCSGRTSCSSGKWKGGSGRACPAYPGGPACTAISYVVGELTATFTDTFAVWVALPATCTAASLVVEVGTWERTTYLALVEGALAAAPIRSWAHRARRLRREGLGFLFGGLCCCSWREGAAGWWPSWSWRLIVAFKQVRTELCQAQWTLNWELIWAPINKPFKSYKTFFFVKLEDDLKF